MLITLGEELLLGLTRNGHLTYIGDQLRQRGVTLHSNYTISDEGDDILDQFRFCWDRADIVITTGGLGPTVDDADGGRRFADAPLLIRNCDDPCSRHSWSLPPSAM